MKNVKLKCLHASSTLNREKCIFFGEYEGVHISLHLSGENGVDLDAKAGEVIYINADKKPEPKK